MKTTFKMILRAIKTYILLSILLVVIALCIDIIETQTHQSTHHNETESL